MGARSNGQAGLGTATVYVSEKYPGAALMSLQEPETEAEFLKTAQNIGDGIGDGRYEGVEDLSGETGLDSGWQVQPLPDEDARTGGLPGTVVENEDPLSREGSSEAEEPFSHSSPASLEAPGFEQRADSPIVEVPAAADAEEIKEGDYKEAVDPWDDPLPAWDYSANEYPVLLGPDRSSNWKKILVPVAVILFFAAAAAGYFLIYPPSLESKEAATAEAPVQNGLQTSEGGAVAPEQPASAEAKSEQIGQPAQTPAPEAASASPVEAAPTTQAAAEAESAGGEFSLQAASFPDEAEARRFSEYLAQKSIPARVVPVDLGRRGRWYRVMVGRFASAEDAEKYAVQARARVASLGMNIQWIVSKHEKP